MALSEATVNKIKVLIYENKKDEAEAVLITETGLSPEEASSYIVRMTDSLPNDSPEKNKPLRLKFYFPVMSFLSTLRTSI